MAHLFGDPLKDFHFVYMCVLLVCRIVLLPLFLLLPFFVVPVADNDKTGRVPLEGPILSSLIAGRRVVGPSGTLEVRSEKQSCSLVPINRVKSRWGSKGAPKGLA